MHLESKGGSLICITKVLNVVCMGTSQGHSIVSAKGIYSHILENEKQNSKNPLPIHRLPLLFSAAIVPCANGQRSLIQ